MPFDSSLGILEKYAPKFDLNVDGLGIITAGDSNVFDGIKVLHSSIKHKINFICYDIGFTEQQKSWAAKNQLTIRPFPVTDAIKSVDKWQTFLKPWFVENSPFEYTIWIDSDCIVTGDLSTSELIQSRQTFFVQHWINQKFLRRSSNKLYETHPVASLDLPYVNAGVFGINKKTHQSIIDDWKMLIDTSFNRNKQLLLYIVNHDEGALNWAIQRNNAGDCIVDDYRYNCYSTFASSHKRELLSSYHQKVFVLEGSNSFPQIVFRKILQNPEPFILHYSTRMDNKGKYWTQWQTL